MRKPFTFITNSKGWCKADKIDCLMIGSLKAGASRVADNTTLNSITIS
jgi:hypothetical protein